MLRGDVDLGTNAMRIAIRPGQDNSIRAQVNISAHGPLPSRLLQSHFCGSGICASLLFATTFVHQHDVHVAYYVQHWQSNCLGFRNLLHQPE